MPKMMQAGPWLIAAIPLALAGCHKERSVEAKNETPQQVANKVAASGIHLQPGRWEATTQVEQINMPGMNPSMRDAMRKNMQKVTFASCLTPEQAAKPNAGFFDSKGNDSCKYDNFTMADGKIDAKLTCAAQGSKQTMTMSGTYTSDAYKLHLDMNGEAAGQAMSMAMSTSASRVGACKGNEGA